MKLMKANPEYVRVAKWDGNFDEQIVTDLRAVGWNVLFQIPVEGEKTGGWDDEKNEPTTGDAPALMVIVGPYRGQYYVVAEGSYLVYSDTDDRFKCWSPGQTSRNWSDAEDTTPQPFPTPDELKAKMDKDGGW